MQRLDSKTGRYSTGLASRGSPGRVGDVDNAKSIVVVAAGGTSPVMGSNLGVLMPILYLTVSSLVVGILQLEILFRAVGVAPGPVVFKFS